jgi:pyruvate ferredoxin oxidoreductase gamma subunit
MGAPITAYNRISDTPCTIHSNIYKPDFVVVVDETLLSCSDVTAGLKSEGAVIINSALEPEALRPHLNGWQGRIYTINAHEVSMNTLGKNFPNTPMLATAVKVSCVVDPEKFLSDMEASFRHKFASKPHVIEGNMKALAEAMRQVKGSMGIFLEEKAG